MWRPSGGRSAALVQALVLAQVLSHLHSEGKTSWSHPGGTAEVEEVLESRPSRVFLYFCLCL